jgi:hypothetical protein
MVDEDEYEALVERRRNEDDFVVDDSKNSSAPVAYVRCQFIPCVTDGLGYHDDGEEHLGVGEDAFDGN